MIQYKLLNLWMTFISHKFVQHGAMALGVYLIVGLRGLIGYATCAMVSRMRAQDWGAIFSRIGDLFQPWTPLF